MADVVVVGDVVVEVLVEVVVELLVEAVVEVLAEVVVELSAAGGDAVIPPIVVFKLMDKAPVETPAVTLPPVTDKVPDTVLTVVAVAPPDTAVDCEANIVETVVPLGGIIQSHEFMLSIKPSTHSSQRFPPCTEHLLQFSEHGAHSPLPSCTGHSVALLQFVHSVRLLQARQPAFDLHSSQPFCPVLNP